MSTLLPMRRFQLLVECAVLQPTPCFRRSNMEISSGKGDCEKIEERKTLGVVALAATLHKARVTSVVAEPSRAPLVASPTARLSRQINCKSLFPSLLHLHFHLFAVRALSQWPCGRYNFRIIGVSLPTTPALKIKS